MAQIVKDYPQDVRLVFKHNPLDFHPNAMPSAIASMAAAKQGKFWEFAEKLFENQKALSDAKYQEIAKALGLNMEQFAKDLADPAIKKKIESDQAAAVALGASGTPAFFVNGATLSGAQPIEEFKKLIDAELKKAAELEKQGVPLEQMHQKLVEKNPNTKKYVDFWIRNLPPPALPPKKAQKPAPKKEEDTKTVWKVTVRPDEHVKGPKHAPVTIVEFSDFQCPFCSKVNPTIKQVMDTYGDKVRVIFKHNPLDFHKDAPLASEATLAAGAQGKFWEMHDLLFANQQSLKREDLEKHATTLGLDMDRFRNDLDAGTFKAWVAEDQELAGQVGAQGTPNLYINGRQLTGAKPFEDLKPVIDEEVKKAEALLAGGTPLPELYGKLVARGKIFSPLDDTVHSIALEGSPSMGPENAPITIVEFSDFQCPYCSKVGVPVKQVYNHYKGRVRVVFKNFPLSFHKEAQLAAEAALAAGAEGRFWEMHDLLFQNQTALKRADLEAYAETLGLDVGAFGKALDARTYRKQVMDDIQLGTRVGVRGTPTVFINGRQFRANGGFSLEAFTKVIDKHVLAK